MKLTNPYAWFFLGFFTVFAAGCPGHLGEGGTLDAGKGVSDKTQKAQAGVASKTSASATTIKEHAEEPQIVAQFAERIVKLNGPATLEDVEECKKLLALSSDKWAKQLEKDAKLGDENRKLHLKLSATASRLDILQAEAEERRKDDAVAPYRKCLYAALLLLLYYAVVKKDPIQSALCGAVAVFCGAAPWLYDSEAFGWLIWVLCGGVAIYACVVFYDILKTRLTAKSAVAVAEKLKETTSAEETEEVLREAGQALNPIAKAGIREARAALGLAEKEAPRLWTLTKKLLTDIF